MHANILKKNTHHNKILLYADIIFTRGFRNKGCH